MIDANLYISLGKACKTRYQLDRFFKSKRANYTESSYFFDWLWGPGIAGATKALSSRLLIRAEDLIIKYVDGKPQVFDITSGYYFLHDFKFSKYACDNETVAIDEMNQQLAPFKTKYEYLASKTIQAIQGRRSDLCMVYHGSLDQGSISQFFDVLKSGYDCEPVVLNVIEFDDQIQETLNQYLAACESGNRVVDQWHTVVVDDRACKGSPHEWRGVNASWDDAFDRAGLARTYS